MKRRNVIILGLLSVWPVAYIFLAMLSVFTGVIADLIGIKFNGPIAISRIFPFFIILHIGTMFEIFALIAFYIHWIFKTNRVDSDKKALWAVVLFCANMIAIPVFWYLYFWKPLTTSPQTEAKNATPEGANH